MTPGFHRPRPQRRNEERILPLVNIVFLMLIFFMLAGQFAVSEPFDIRPAVSRSPSDTSGGRTVLISAAGGIAVDGRVVTAEGLPAALGEPGPIPVRIKADASAETRLVVATMWRLQAAGFEQIELMTVAGAGR